MRTDNGIIGTLTASWAYVTGGDNSTIIYGEKGTLRLEDNPKYSLIEEYHDGSVIYHKLDKIQTMKRVVNPPLMSSVILLNVF